MEAGAEEGTEGGIRRGQGVLEGRLELLLNSQLASPTAHILRYTRMRSAVTGHLPVRRHKARGSGRRHKSAPSPTSDQPEVVAPGRFLCHTPTPGSCVASLMVNRSLA